MLNKDSLTSEQKKIYSEQVRKLKSIFSTGRCMFYGADCSEQTIRSHTVSKARYLSQVAEGNQVLQWKTNAWESDLIKATDLKPEYTSKATTFPGFCAHHDSSLFKCVDEEEFTATSEQLFMLAYRSGARDIHGKQAELIAFPSPQDIARFSGQYDTDAETIDYLGLIASHNSISVGARDCIIQYGKFQAILECSDYRRLHSCIVPFRFSGRPFIASASSFFPDFDAGGRIIQDFSNGEEVLNTIYVNVLPSLDQSYAIFSFLDCDANGPKQLIDSVIASERLGDLLAWIPLTYTENVAIRPSWWRHQSPDFKMATQKTFRNSLDRSTEMEATIAKCPATFNSGIVPGTPSWSLP